MTDAQAELQRLLVNLQSDDLMTASQASSRIMQLGEIAVEPLIAILKDDSKSRIWYLAVSGLGYIRDSRAVEPLIDLLNNPASFNAILSRKDAAYALGQLNDARAVDTLLDLLHERRVDEEEGYDEADSETILAAAGALTEIGDIRALEPIINRIFEGEDYWQNGETLTPWGEPALHILLKLLESEDEVKRRGAASLLGEFGDKRAVEPLIERLRNDPSERVRHSAAYGLSDLRDNRAFDALMIALHDSYEQTRAYAAIGLGNLGDMRAFSALTEATQDEHPLVRNFAKTGLEALKIPRN